MVDGKYECSRCGLWKEPDQFYRDRANNRVQSWCKKCRVATTSARNKIVRAARKRRWEGADDLTDAQLDALVTDPNPAAD